MDPSLPYPSNREPVIAANIVSTGQPLAAQAGLSMIAAGGNAADAIVATAAALTVVEPTANGLGSDSFALIWDGSKLHGLNASGRSPMGLPRSHFGDTAKMPTAGWEAVTVPGAVSGWRAISQKFGKLPFEKLLAPAIHYAQMGYGVSPQCAAGWEKGIKKYKDFPEWARTFAPNGRTPRMGELVRLPHHAETLKLIASSGAEEFYRGSIARQIAEAAKRDGAWMTEADLASHAPFWVEPWSIRYRDVEVHEIPPNGQGLAALIALGIVRNFDMASLARDCPDVLHVQIEAIKAAFADARAHVADPALGADHARPLLDEASLKDVAAKIDMKRASSWTPRPLPKSGTVFLCAADADGMMVSYIQSNYEGFGSGIVIPGTGITMQNRGACFSLEPGHLNEYAPGKRPYHTIIPAFMTRGGQPLCAFGVMGGFMQPQGHLQVTVRMIDQGLNPQAALDAPRFQLMDDGKIAMEPGFPAGTLDELRARGHALDIHKAATVLFGGGQAIWRQPDGPYIAGSDFRRDGEAVGF